MSHPNNKYRNFKNKFPQRAALYVLALFIMAIGVVLSVRSGLGISPFNSMCYAIASVLRLELSVTLNLALLLCIILQIVLLNKEFQMMNLTQIVWACLFSWFVNRSEALLDGVIVSTYAGQQLLLLISIFLIGLGIEIYMNVELVPMPSDSLILSISHRCGDVPYHKIKVLFDCTCVSIGIVVSLVFVGKLVGVREGTILSALLIGTVTKILRRPVIPILRRICREGKAPC